jgi:hypothetical protein
VPFPNSARVSPDERYPREAGGVVYFVADTDFSCTGAPVRQLALFALVHTSELCKANPDVGRMQLVHTLLDSLVSPGVEIEGAAFDEPGPLE